MKYYYRIINELSKKYLEWDHGAFTKYEKNTMNQIFQMFMVMLLNIYSYGGKNEK
ncbi:hypothetical protein ABGF48_05235 [Helcococcus bovis]|uniref:hypothetical protein n=1 Tax=Helcococcus bovis TaxID=3153252 RepID=UPI0038B94623